MYVPLHVSLCIRSYINTYIRTIHMYHAHAPLDAIVFGLAGNQCRDKYN